jgi:predicted enzyme related to lactoylglutathione lyase
MRSWGPRGVLGRDRLDDADDERPFPDDVPPHWSVTFAVDDTDAIARRTAELGGKIVVPPFDVEVVRIAVLSDPQGAVFSVNKFQPR